MNAKSERASLPDRVEAAVEAFNEYVKSHSLPRLSPFDGSKAWDVPTEEAIAAALAAADACEAERNPNTPDFKRLIERSGLRIMRCDYCSELCLADKRSLCHGESVRPVSSEDVHREAAE